MILEVRNIKRQVMLLVSLLMKRGSTDFGIMGIMELFVQRGSNIKNCVTPTTE